MGYEARQKLVERPEPSRLVSFQMRVYSHCTLETGAMPLLNAVQVKGQIEPHAAFAAANSLLSYKSHRPG